MVDWRTFIPADFEYDFEADKLRNHHVTLEEAVECFFSDFVAAINETMIGFNWKGRTFAGRPLKLIFQLKTGRVVRIITGWPI